MKTDYKGIDYGMGATNIDKETGIRYGVIPQNEVLQAWADESEPEYGEPDYIECPSCGQEFATPEGLNWGDMTTCEFCHEKFEIDISDFAEPIGYVYENDGYQAQQSFDDPDIFVMKSPYFTYAQFCSPCAPGACYLLNPLEEKDQNNRVYCFGHDWFEEGKAPYPVYDVKTGKRVE